MSTWSAHFGQDDFFLVLVNVNFLFTPINIWVKRTSYQVLNVYLHSSVGKEFACNVGDLGLVPGLGRSPGEGNGNPLQCSCLENLMDKEA